MVPGERRLVTGRWRVCQRLSVTFLLAYSLLPIGCKSETGSPTTDRSASPRAEVTLHVADMTERQGLT